MNVPSEESKSDDKQSLHFSDGIHNTVLKIFKWLSWFFTLTEEDQIEAGIAVRQAGKHEE